MTIQFPQVETTDSRLLTDSFTQTYSDHSFEKKLELEKARLGLIFSPLSQFDSFFSYPQGSTFNLDFSTDQPKVADSLESQLLKARQSGSTPPPKQPTPKEFKVLETQPLKTLNRQFIQEILTQTGWLTPNLAAQPLFFQASINGTLKPKFDLQLLVDEIASNVKMVKDKGKTELSLTLKPENLGEILLTLTSQAGQIAIQIHAQGETKKILEDELETLKNLLKISKVHFSEIKIEEGSQHV